MSPCSFIFFFFNDTATTEIYPLSLHDALPIYVHLHADAAGRGARGGSGPGAARARARRRRAVRRTDRKSTRLNSSHSQISYAVFCLKKKKLQSSSYLLLVISTHHVYR